MKSKDHPIQVTRADRADRAALRQLMGTRSTESMMTKKSAVSNGADERKRSAIVVHKYLRAVPDMPETVRQADEQACKAVPLENRMHAPKLRVSD